MEYPILFYSFMNFFQHTVNIQSSGDAFSDIFVAFYLLFLMGGYFVVLLILLMVGIALSHTMSRSFGWIALGLYVAPVVALYFLSSTTLGYSVDENIVLVSIGVVWLIAIVLNLIGLFKFAVAHRGSR